MITEPYTIPVYTGSMTSRLRGAFTMRTDQRVRIMNEIVNAMRVIKMYGWENAFGKVVAEARKWVEWQSGSLIIWYANGQTLSFFIFLYFITHVLH